MSQRNKTFEKGLSLGEKKLILYYYTKPTTFVKRDIEMLRHRYEVKEFSFFHPSKLFTPVLFLKQLLFILQHQSRASLAFCMFAGYHSLLPAWVGKLTQKPFVIILGGTESVSIPSIGYGIINKGLIGKFAKWSYRLTAHFAPVHQTLVYSNNTYYQEEGQFQGIKHYVKNIQAGFTVIHNGYDHEKFKRKPVDRLKNSFITVAHDLHKPHIRKLKGVDLILEIAQDLPDCQFTIVGLPEYKNCPANVSLMPAMGQDELIEHFSRQTFYFQLSLSEGFPNALCEAMLCNCIPVVSNVASMPEIVGDAGFVLKKRDPNMLKKLISEEVIHADLETLSERAREAIVSRYPLNKRKKRFYALIEALIK